MGIPKSYRSLEEFEREELGRDSQAGFNLDDLIQEATFGASDMLFDDTVDEYDPAEMRRRRLSATLASRLILTRGDVPAQVSRRVRPRRMPPFGGFFFASVQIRSR